MKKNNYHWAIPLTGAVLFSTAVSAEQDKYTYLDSTNRITLSLRFGLNISGRFRGMGGSLNPAAAAGNGQRTPNGDPYNYDDGYNLTPSASPNPAFTTYWGYDNASQLIPGGGGYAGVALSRSTATGIPAEESADANPSPGFELTYDRKLGEKENWHHMFYGLEGAANYMNFSFNDSSVSSVNVTRTTYDFLFPFPVAIPPSNAAGSGITPGRPSLSVSPTGAPTVTTSSEAFSFQDQFNANLWGFRLGPYVEFPLTKKLSLHVSGGLALGLIDGHDSWKETLNGTPASGGGEAFDMLWGGYLGADLTWQINKRWSIEGGAQFQDIGKYNHSFSGRVVELDLSRSLFVEVGVGYSF